MECPICGEELVWEDYFGRIASHQDGTVPVDIYVCPNGVEQNEKCESELFYVAGHFYSYRNGDGTLHEGYPC